MGDVEQEINLDEITDESLLNNLLDQTEDVEDRKAIRARIQELRAAEKAKREVKTTKSTTSIEDRREESLQKKQREAAEHKQRTLAMYDQMAKSAPAGGDKKMDVGIYKNSESFIPGTPAGSISGIKSSDLVDDAIRQRQRDAEERKKRMLAAYDAAARSAPSGQAIKDVNFEAFKKADVSDYHQTKVDSGATYGSSGGIAKVSKGSQPGTPVSPLPGGISFPQGPPPVDAMERIIRARQQEADERKRRTLAAYDIIGKQGAGPKVVCLEEFRNVNVDKVRLGTSSRSSAGFSGGISRV